MSTTHVLRPARTSRRPNFITLALVGALHVVVIYGLYLGLSGRLQTIVPYSPFVVVPVHPTPPQPHLDQPQIKLIQLGVPGIKLPVIQIDSSKSGIGIIQTDNGQTNTNVGPTPVIVAARGIMGTHSTPDYPSIAVRLNQTGNVLLKLTVDERGAVVAATVEKSSGYDSLDNAAVAWVIAHWRYEPATKDGKPFATTTDALVTFRLTGR